MEGDVETARWSAIVPLLREFESYLASDAPKLVLQVANDRNWTWAEYEERRREHRLTIDNGGVYLIFDNNAELRYVGLAMYAFDNRIWSHDDHVSRCWTDIITFAPEWHFLAPALEFFLIARLQPPANSTYLSYRVPERQRPGSGATGSISNEE